MEKVTSNEAERTQEYRERGDQSERAGSRRSRKVGLRESRKKRKRREPIPPFFSISVRSTTWKPYRLNADLASAYAERRKSSLPCA